MLKNVFLKTIFEKRLSTFFWSLALAFLTFITIQTFPALKEALGQSLKDVPESVEAFLGSAETFQNLNKYLDVQVFAQMVFMTLIMGVILGSGLIAGEEGEGTLQTLLTHPVKRRKVYWQKAAALAAVVGIVSLVIFLISLLGVGSVKESVSAANLFYATLMLFLVTMVFSLIAFSLGAITGRRGISGALAGGLGFVSLLVTSLSGGVEWLKKVNNFSPFNYFNKPSALEAGLQVGDALILLGACAFFALLGYLFFVRRDVFQR